MPFNLVPYRKRLAELAAEGVLIGTSSWKYPGWCGQIYTESRYRYRDKFAKIRFEKGCLEEYALTFPTVCVDAAFYTFPTEIYIAILCQTVPQGFRFAFKVTDEITIKKFPGVDRFKDGLGLLTPHF